MNEIKTETAPENTETTSENTQEPVELIEMVRAKHSEETVYNSERMSDVLFMQLILCVLLVLVFAVIKMIEGDTTAWFVSEFKSMTNGAAEEFIKQAVSKAIQSVK